MSISRNVVNNIIEFRNPDVTESVNPVKALAAEVAFLVVIPFAIVEAALMNIARIFACLPLDRRTCDRIHSWANSSSYALVQALVSLITNLCSHTLKRWDAAAPPPPPPGPGGFGGGGYHHPDPIPVHNYGRRANPAQFGAAPPIGRRNPDPVPSFIPPPRNVEPAEPDLSGEAPVLVGDTFAEKVRGLFETHHTTDKLKEFRDALGADNDDRSIYAEAIEWREINDNLVDALAPLPRPAAQPFIHFRPAPQPYIPFGYGQPAAPAADYGAIGKDLPAALLNQYRLGVNGTRVSDVFERMYARLPNPIPAERNLMKNNFIPQFLNREVSADRVQYKLDAGNGTWKELVIKMLWGIFQHMPRLTPDETEVVRQLMTEAFTNCSNRMSTEVERIYYKYVERDMMELYETALTPEECLVYELTQFRMDMRDLVINTECPDIHNAASHNYYRRELNEDVFHLPRSPLSGEDNHYQQYAMQQKRGTVIANFNRIYNNAAVIAHVRDMVTDEGGRDKVYKFKPAMFVQWLKDTGRQNADSFEDDMMTVYKSEVIATFLEEKRFLQRV